MAKRNKVLLKGKSKRVVELVRPGVPPQVLRVKPQAKVSEPPKPAQPAKSPEPPQTDILEPESRQKRQPPMRISGRTFRISPKVPRLR